MTKKPSYAARGTISLMVMLPLMMKYVVSRSCAFRIGHVVRLEEKVPGRQVLKGLPSSANEENISRTKSHASLKIPVPNI